MPSLRFPNLRVRGSFFTREVQFGRGIITSGHNQSYSFLKQQLAKIENCTLNTTHSARNLGFIFDEHLTFSDQISALSKSCYSHIHELRCIRPYLDLKTANTIATSIVHSKLDYCNSLYYNLPYSQLNRLQQIQNCFARAVFKAPKFTHTTPILKSLHWLKINQRIEYKIPIVMQNLLFLPQRWPKPSPCSTHCAYTRRDGQAE